MYISCIERIGGLNLYKWIPAIKDLFLLSAQYKIGLTPHDQIINNNTKTHTMRWSFAHKWNEGLLGVERPAAKRDYVYASELGTSYIDRFLKMNGVVPTNPPNARSKRKFAAGEIWEDIVKMVLIRAGILISKQQKIDREYQGLLPVHGRLDFIAGGIPDYDKAVADLKDLEMTDKLRAITMAILDEMKGGLLDEYVLEIKSCSSLIFPARQKKYSIHNALQNFYYARELKLDGKLVYINKDDCMIAEWDIPFNDQTLEREFMDDLKKMTDIYQSGQMPEKAPEVIFEDSFKKNWQVEYSNYLTMIYGYATPEDYRERWKCVSSWNAVIKRIVEGKDMTAKNKEYLEDMKKQFPHLDEIIDYAKSKGIEEEPEPIN